MATLNEICFSIIDTVRPKQVSGDPITKELVAFHVHNLRAQLARQTIHKYGKLGAEYIQSLGCIQLVLVDKSECCSFPTGCLILRTTVQIPQMINGGTSLMTRVGPVNLGEPRFDEIHFESVPFQGLNKFTRSLKKCFRMNNSGYVYILISEDDYLSNGLEVINIQGALDNPEDAGSFINCSTGLACFDSDSQYPIPSSVIPILQDMVIKSFVGIQVRAPMDITNNSMVDPRLITDK